MPGPSSSTVTRAASPSRSTIRDTRPASGALTDAGRAALEEYEGARLRGLTHDDAELAASNSLQRAGYNVNARGGVTIQVLE